MGVECFFSLGREPNPSSRNFESEGVRSPSETPNCRNFRRLLEPFMALLKGLLNKYGKKLRRTSRIVVDDDERTAFTFTSPGEVGFVDRHGVVAADHRDERGCLVQGRITREAFATVLQGHRGGLCLPVAMETTFSCCRVMTNCMIWLNCHSSFNHSTSLEEWLQIRI